MNVFGKILNSRPPALPKRRDGNSHAERHQDKHEEEEEDCMYEAPPCERQVSVPQMPKEENVYLERSPAIPQRRGPPPQPPVPKSCPGYVLVNSENMKPPDVFRTDKPGRKKMAVPVPVTPSPKPKEDEYLDPCEENESSEDLYLEPGEACSQLPTESKSPPFFKPAFPTPEPMLNPPRPLERSVSPTATAPKVEARRFSSPKVTPPVPSQPRPLSSQREKLGLPEPTAKDNKPGASVRVGRGPKAQIEVNLNIMQLKPGLKECEGDISQNRPWFSEDCNRKKAEDLLLSVKKDGAFLVRNCSTQSSHQPYTLAVLYQQKVYNIPVRFLQGETPGFALGKEGKKNEEVFSSLDDMISFHKSHKLLLIDSKSQAKHTTHLTHAAAP